MSIEFKETCFSEVANFIANTSDPKPHFTYATVDSAIYSNQYFIRSEDEYTLGRWAYAVPGMVVATIKTIYHIAKLILVECPRKLFCRQKSLAVHTFTIARDLQELTGRFISIFHVPTGQYLVESSEFHKTCYDMYLEAT